MGRFTAGLLTLLVLLLSGCNWVYLVSVSSDGEQGNSDSDFAKISADGRLVAFRSIASTLVSDPNNPPDPNDPFAHDPNTPYGVYVHDTVDGTTRKVSVNSAGEAANEHSFPPAISGDGRYVAFSSEANNLVADDYNFAEDVFLHDLETGETSRVSLGNTGSEGNYGSAVPALSHDGRYVAFLSGADNFVPENPDPYYRSNIFLRDRLNETTQVVSVDNDGNHGNSNNHQPVISADGLQVAFVSHSDNLVVGDNNNYQDVFVHDSVTGITTLASVSSLGVQGNYTSHYPAISGDGHFVAFQSRSETLVPDDTNAQTDVFVYDRVTAQTTRVSVDSAGVQGNSNSSEPSLSHDGRYVAFHSNASNLVPDDTNGTTDAFVHDRQTGVTHRVSLDAMGAEVSDGSMRPALSADGKYVAFYSWSNDLVPGDDNSSYDSDVFVRAVPQLSISAVEPSAIAIGATTTVTITGSNFLAGVTPSLNAQLSNIVIIDETTLTVDVAVPAGAAPGTRNVMVKLLGGAPGIATGAAAFCNGCLTVF